MCAFVITQYGRIFLLSSFSFWILVYCTLGVWYPSATDDGSFASFVVTRLCQGCRRMDSERATERQGSHKLQKLSSNFARCCVKTISTTTSKKIMDRSSDDTTPAEEWLQQLNAVCNRLSTQYLNLLRTASSVSALDETRHDPRCK